MRLGVDVTAQHLALAVKPILCLEDAAIANFASLPMGLTLPTPLETAHCVYLRHDCGLHG